MQIKILKLYCTKAQIKRIERMYHILSQITDAEYIIITTELANISVPEQIYLK